jgi:hypothetical protein
MDTRAPSGSVDTEGEPPALRRRVLKSALAVAAGGALQTFPSADAVAQAVPGAPPAAKRTHRWESPMQEAIQACLDCHSMCLRMATTLCLQKGGRHVEQKHLASMLNCAELCQTSANFMLSDSPLHGRVCLICAEACEACAKSCEQVGDMRECVEECKSCAKSCRTMT